MKKLYFGIAAVLISCFMIVPGVFAYSYSADPIVVGDIIKFIDRPGSPGGEFGVDLFSPVDDKGELFRTFCIQTSEYLAFGYQFKVIGISDHAVAGGNPLNDETAWLYSKFISGTLPGYVSDLVHANALQLAIWGFEGQSLLYSGTPQEQVDAKAQAEIWSTLASAAVSGGWSNNDRVKILNLAWNQNYGDRFKIGDNAQDVLIYVPEPATLLLLGSGLLGLALYRRKNS